MMRPERPTPASLFQRDRTPPAPSVGGLEKLQGHSTLTLPIAGRIVTLEFQTALSSARGVATLRLELAPQAAAHLRMHFVFANVRELSLAALPAEGLDCAGFDIRDASAMQRTGVNWEAGDFLGGAIHFYAEEAEIISIAFA